MEDRKIVQQQQAVIMLPSTLLFVPTMKWIHTYTMYELAKMSFDEILDLSADVFYFDNILLCPTRTTRKTTHPWQPLLGYFPPSGVIFRADFRQHKVGRGTHEQERGGSGKRARETFPPICLPYVFHGRWKCLRREGFVSLSQRSRNSAFGSLAATVCGLACYVHACSRCSAASVLCCD